MPRTKNYVRRWTEEEDRLLEHFVSQQGTTSHSRTSLTLLPEACTTVHDGSPLLSDTPEGDTVDWRQIARRIPGRSNKDCRKRWVYGISPLLNKGPWDEDEDVRLREAVELHGCR